MIIYCFEVSGRRYEIVKGDATHYVRRYVDGIESRAPLDDDQVMTHLDLAIDDPYLASKVIDEEVEEQKEAEKKYSRVEWDFTPYKGRGVIYVAFERARSKH